MRQKKVFVGVPAGLLFDVTFSPLRLTLWLFPSGFCRGHTPKISALSPPASGRRCGVGSSRNGLWSSWHEAVVERILKQPAGAISSHVLSLLVTGTFILTSVVKTIMQGLWMGDPVGRGTDGLLHTIPFPGPSTHDIAIRSWSPWFKCPLTSLLETNLPHFAAFFPSSSTMTVWSPHSSPPCAHSRSMGWHRWPIQE